MSEEDVMPYCERAKTCRCHGCDPPPGKPVQHCYQHGRGCHKGAACKKKPGPKGDGK